MGYYHIDLSLWFKQLYTSVFLRIKYMYQKLPMGLCNSPYISQENIFEISKGFDMLRAYIYDIQYITKHHSVDHL